MNGLVRTRSKPGVKSNKVMFRLYFGVALLISGTATLLIGLLLD